KIFIEYSETGERRRHIFACNRFKPGLKRCWISTGCNLDIRHDLRPYPAPLEISDGRIRIDRQHAIEIKVHIVGLFFGYAGNLYWYTLVTHINGFAKGRFFTKEFFSEDIGNHSLVFSLKRCLWIAFLQRKMKERKESRICRIDSVFVV